MNRDTRDHVRQLLEINRAHLRELELQAAKFGDLHVPSHIILQIAEYRRKLTEQEEQLATMMPLHNLPPRDYERFVGRQTELAEVRRLLSPRSRAFVITIDGIGGIGKSALALEAAYSLCDVDAILPDTERFEAIVWVSAKRSYLTADGIIERRQAFRTLSDVYAAIAQVLDFPAITRARAEEQRAIVEEVLSEQRTLLILDNLETVDDEDLIVFLRELPAPTKAVVTTRHRIDVAHPVRLTEMPHQDALALIEQEAIRKEAVVTADDREQLWQRTGGVPLAIVWSIGLMGLGGSVESVLRRLGNRQSNIAQFCFAESVAQIRGRDAYWLLLALSLFAVDASREALGMVAGLGTDTFGRDAGLEDLLRLSLVNKDGDRFSLLPLTRNFAESLLEEEWKADAKSRLVDFIYKLPKIDENGRIEWDDVSRLEREFPNIRAVSDLLTVDIEHVIKDDGDIHIASASVEKARRFLVLNRVLIWASRYSEYWFDSESYCHTGIKFARALGDDFFVANRYKDLSDIYISRGDLIKAKQCAEMAAVIFLQHGNHKAASHITRRLGIIMLLQGNINDAEALIKDAYDKYTSLGSGASIVNYCTSLGRLAEAVSDLVTAEQWYRKAVEESRLRNNPYRTASSLHSLGHVYIRLGSIQNAYSALDESLQLAVQYGFVEVIAQCRLDLARIAAERNSASAAINARQALDLFHRMGMRKEQAEAEALLRQLGEQS